MITTEQREQRRSFIGGSDAAVVLGLAPYGKSRYELYLDKRGELPEEEPAEQPEHIELGNEMEDVIAQVYTKRTGRTVETVGTIIHPDYPWMGVNMDRLIVNDPRGPGYLEIKNYGYWHGKDIRSMSELPDDVFVQVQHGLEVARKQHGVHWGSVAILIGGTRLFWCDVERQEDLIRVMIEEERAFMERVKAGTPPDPDYKSMREDFLKRMYPKDSGKTIRLDSPEIVQVATELGEWKERLKEATDEVEARKNCFKLLMKDASVAEIPGFGKMTWKCSKTSSKVVLDEEKLKAEHPAIYAECLKKIPTGGIRSFYDRPAKDEEKAKDAA